MINVQPVSNLKNKYQEYDKYIECLLDEADREAENPNTKYYSHEEFKQITSRILEDKK